MLAASAYSLPGIVRSKPTRDEIVSVTCTEFNARHERVVSKCRKRELVYPRQVIMRLMIERGYSTKAAGLVVMRDHATAIHAVKAVDRMMMYDDLAEKIIRVREKLGMS